MFLAKLAMLVNAVAKYSCAPGAMSWTISSIAVPSSHDAVALHWPAAVPLCPGSTVTGPRSPERLRGRQIAHAVGQHADLDAGAVGSVGVARGGGAMRQIRFGLAHAGDADVVGAGLKLLEHQGHFGAEIALALVELRPRRPEMLGIERRVGPLRRRPRPGDRLLHRLDEVISGKSAIVSSAFRSISARTLCDCGYALRTFAPACRSLPRIGTDRGGDVDDARLRSTRAAP